MIASITFRSSFFSNIISLLRLTINLKPATLNQEMSISLKLFLVAIGGDKHTKATKATKITKIFQGVTFTLTRDHVGDPTSACSTLARARCATGAPTLTLTRA